MSNQKTLKTATALLIILQACQPSGQSLSKLANDPAPTSPDPISAPGTNPKATSMCFKQVFRCDSELRDFSPQSGTAWDPVTQKIEAWTRTSKFIACSWASPDFVWDWNTEANMGPMVNLMDSDLQGQNVAVEFSTAFDSTLPTSEYNNQNLFDAIQSQNTQVRIFMSELVDGGAGGQPMIYVEVLDPNLQLSICNN